MRFTSRLTPVLFGILALAACGKDASGPDGATATVTGNYTLKTINGSPLPFTLIAFPGYSARLISSTLTVNSDNTFVGSSTYQETENGVTSTISESCNGTITRNGNALSFTEAPKVNTECGGTFTGTWDGAARVTIDFDPSVKAVFEK